VGDDDDDNNNCNNNNNNNLLSSATSEIPTVSTKFTVRLVTWLARIHRAVSTNAAAHLTMPLYHRVHMRILIVLSHPVLIHLMKDISAMFCVCNSAQYACSAHIHINKTRSQRRYRCGNSEIHSSALIQIKVFWYMTSCTLVNTDWCRCFGVASWLHRKCTGNSQCLGGVGGEEPGKNYRGPTLQKGAQGLTILHMFLSFSVVTDVIR